MFARQRYTDREVRLIWSFLLLHHWKRKLGLCLPEPGFGWQGAVFAKEDQYPCREDDVSVVIGSVEPGKISKAKVEHKKHRGKAEKQE